MPSCVGCTVLPYTALGKLDKRYQSRYCTSLIADLKAIATKGMPQKRKCLSTRRIINRITIWEANHVEVMLILSISGITSIISSYFWDALLKWAGAMLRAVADLGAARNRVENSSSPMKVM